MEFEKYSIISILQMRLHFSLALDKLHCVVKQVDFVLLLKPGTILFKSGCMNTKYSALL